MKQIMFGSCMTYSFSMTGTTSIPITVSENLSPLRIE